MARAEALVRLTYDVWVELEDIDEHTLMNMSDWDWAAEAEYQNFDGTGAASLVDWRVIERR